MANSGQFTKRDYTGHRSGKLVCISPAGAKDKYGYSIWRMKCDCGNEIERTAQAITRAQPLRSCGCGPKGRPAVLSKMEGFYAKARINAERRNLVFTLDLETFERLSASPCNYCGDAPRERPHPYINGTIVANGIDRVDSSLGYTPENCVPCCKICNQAKNDLPLEVFIAWLKRAYLHSSSTSASD